MTERDATTQHRRQLLELVPGIASWVNGVPVKRLPCAGAWFDVGACWEPHDEHWQRLCLADALSRVNSGHYPRLEDPPGMRRYYGGVREAFRLQRNAELERDGVP